MSWQLDRTGMRLRKAVMLPIALPVVAGVRLALSLAGYARLVAWLPQSAGIGDRRRIDATARAVQIAACLVPGATCLTQAVATRTLLAWIGHHSWIRIGVRRDDKGAIKAHAWLLDGRNRIVIGGTRSELARFHLLTDLDRPHPR